jgi:uncharacterized RDD family membrane protein YckC
MRRLLAFCLDEAIVLLVWFTAALWLVIVYGSVSRAPDALPALALLVMAALAVGPVLHAVYFVGFVGGCGQTPAKMVSGLRVVCPDGGYPGYGRALARWIGYGLVIATLGLGVLVAALNAERRGIHDWISGTRVVRD